MDNKLKFIVEMLENFLWTGAEMDETVR